jgi:predicted nucleotide-binding protein
MSLPIRTTDDDVMAMCSYLATKPTGATLREAAAVVDKKVLDGRKLSALKCWSLIDEADGRVKLTELGRRIAKDKGARRSEVFREIIGAVPPYRASVERAVHSQEFSVSATEVAAHWHEHFRDEASANDKILNDQAVCFFQIAEAADLGKIVIGRRGQPTRFEFDPEMANRFITEESDLSLQTLDLVTKPAKAPSNENGSTPHSVLAGSEETRNIKRVFITHGKNHKILTQVKELVIFGKFEPIVAQEHETTAHPVPEKVINDMRSCQAAVIHVAGEGTVRGKDGKERPHINENVLIEIGASMALYGRNFILLVEEGLDLPSNLQGLYQCRYVGEELNMEATMKILKTFNEFV